MRQAFASGLIISLRLAKPSLGPVRLRIVSAFKPSKGTRKIRGSKRLFSKRARNSYHTYRIPCAGPFTRNRHSPGVFAKAASPGLRPTLALFRVKGPTSWAATLFGTALRRNSVPSGPGFSRLAVVSPPHGRQVPTLLHPKVRGANPALQRGGSISFGPGNCVGTLGASHGRKGAFAASPSKLLDDFPP